MPTVVPFSFSIKIVFILFSSEDISCRGGVGRRTSSPARTCDTDLDLPEMEMVYSDTDDVSRDLNVMSIDEREEELCQLVINALFTIMWRGGNTNSKQGTLSDDVIKDRGQVCDTFNFLLHFEIVIVSCCGKLNNSRD